MKPISRPIKRSELLSLPVRKWDEKSLYDTLYLVPTNKKHDSGYGILAVIGANYTDKKNTLLAEIAAYCDDLGWSFPIDHPYGRHEPYAMTGNILRLDVEYPSRIIRAWASCENYFKGKFLVGYSLSSTQVELILEPDGDPKNLENARSHIIRKIHLC